MKSNMVELEAQHHHHHDNHDDQHHKEEDQKRRGCRPIACLLGFPFAISAFLLSLAGGIVWILGSLLSYVCPCLSCCADLANKAMDIIKLPIDVFRWFIDKIPC
ncbi:signaling peptide TAXIMIN 2-like [Amaranthus tricolor]|uniref:signaling peptide TAXIMIN 2-like n=1 Tax=Amaranthus tricolor TaxID=29722 RepID=UPI00258686C4|nr:signaling peptide TAXIMIN 2-like [Amaranthus tricolor]